MNLIKKYELDNKILILLVFVSIIIISSIITVSVPVFAIQILFGGITIPILIKAEYKTAKIYIVIFLISVFFVLFVYLENKTYYGNSYYLGGSDDLSFERLANIVYNSRMYNPSKILNSGIIGSFNNSTFFVIYISLLMHFADAFGSYSTFIPRIANVYFLLWVCMIFNYILTTHTNFSKKKIRFTIIVFALMPNIQYINSHVFRDTFNLLQVFLIIILFDKLISTKNMLVKVINIALLIIVIYMTYYTRINSLIFSFIIVFISLINRYKLKKIYVVLISLISLLLILSIFKFFRVDYYIDTYSGYVSNIAGDGLSGYVFNRSLLPFGIVMRFFYAFITPFPDFLGLFSDPKKFLFDLNQFLIYSGVLIQILAIPFILKRLIKVDWLTVVFLSLFIGVIATTFTFRHVMFYYPFMVAVAIDGYSNTDKKNRDIILVATGFIAVCFSMIYIFLKFL